MLLVSHDRRFLENVTTRIVSVRDGKAEIFQGGWRDYVSAHAPPPPSRSSPARRRPAPRARPPEGRGERHEEGEEVPRQSYEEKKQADRDREKRKRRIAELENGIALGETELAMLREELKKDPGGDWGKLAEMAEREQALARKLEAMMTEWAKLSDEEGK